MLLWLQIKICRFFIVESEIYSFFPLRLRWFKDSFHESHKFGGVGKDHEWSRRRISFLLARILKSLFRWTCYWKVFPGLELYQMIKIKRRLKILNHWIMLINGDFTDAQIGCSECKLASSSSNYRWPYSNLVIIWTSAEPGQDGNKLTTNKDWECS